MNENIRQYFVIVGDNDPIVVTVKDDVNRPNNPDCDEVLTSWITNNYGYVNYQYWEIDTCEKHEI
ncbi:hypothetical protein PP175_29080 (plasmid) [Aneurinibacillus sp. Ricciae_BoGa-3]|uniref:hypothetical protein n=1 Tax=Aneurinibacillus sp. Ricciae_BoGa-3 TaxID=3022697 RepID=UPI0023422667|nr:hypothetical protein [Aneurinibacillus sp. Ricciae_BoGa-3]WCK57246.1 hypothetical protein PP175_29080 [Aneurinibacillus sp. Ricciae_BoGa-3]